MDKRLLTSYIRDLATILNAQLQQVS